MTDTDLIKKSINALGLLLEVDLIPEDSYQKIYDIINDQVIIPFVTITIPIGQVFYRARINDDYPFKSKSDISYNTKLDKIKIGRANYFNQSVFYASHKEETAILETSNSIKNKELGNNELITVGQWTVTKPIEVISIIHDKEFQRKNEILKCKYMSYLKTNSSFNLDWVQTHLEFISTQFARKVNVFEEYKISCAFFNIMKEKMFNNGGAYGIMFPTVEFEKNDLNIAITPECVDNHLSLTQIAEFMINNKHNKQGGIFQVKTGDCLEFKMNDLIINKQKRALIE